MIGFCQMICLVYHSPETKGPELPELAGVEWRPAISNDSVLGHLWWTPEGPYLACAEGLWRPDFGAEWERWQKRAPIFRKTPLGKALGLQRDCTLKILDASVGTARDALLLLYWEQEVYACERHPLLFVLLWDALARWKRSNHPDALHFSDKFHLVFGESAEAFSGTTFDRIFYDPMYASNGRKSSALGRKEMEILKQLIGVENDSEAVFLKLWQRCPYLVVKRGPLSPLLHPSVNAQWKSKALRLDKYLR